MHTLIWYCALLTSDPLYIRACPMYLFLSFKPDAGPYDTYLFHPAPAYHLNAHVSNCVTAPSQACLISNMTLSPYLQHVECAYKELLHNAHLHNDYPSYAFDFILYFTLLCIFTSIGWLPVKFIVSLWTCFMKKKCVIFFKGAFKRTYTVHA